MGQAGQSKQTGLTSEETKIVDHLVYKHLGKYTAPPSDLRKELYSMALVSVVEARKIHAKMDGIAYSTILVRRIEWDFAEGLGHILTGQKRRAKLIPHYSLEDYQIGRQDVVLEDVVESLTRKQVLEALKQYPLLRKYLQCGTVEALAKQEGLSKSWVSRRLSRSLGALRVKLGVKTHGRTVIGNGIGSVTKCLEGQRRISCRVDDTGYTVSPYGEGPEVYA